MAELTREHVEAIKAGNKRGRPFAFHFAPAHTLAKVGKEEFSGNCIAVTRAAPADPVEFKKRLKMNVGDSIVHARIDWQYLIKATPTQIKSIHAPAVLALNVAVLHPHPQPFHWEDFGLMSKKTVARIPPFNRDIMAYKIINMPTAQLKRIVAKAQRLPAASRIFALHNGISEWFADALIKHWKKRAGR